MNALWTFVLCIIFAGAVPILNRIATALEKPPICQQSQIEEPK